MAQLIAVSGMVTIAHTNREPVRDLQALFEHIHEHATSLQVEASRIGVMAVSGNVPTALTAIMEETSRAPSCAVFGYGCRLDLDGINADLVIGPAGRVPRHQATFRG